VGDILAVADALLRRLAAEDVATAAAATPPPLPPLLLVGHSMGGALAARAAAAAAAAGALPTLRGLALLDIVEGTALAAAPAMRAALAARPARFPDAFAARAWARASPAASPSLLSQRVPARDGSHGLVWRTPLLETAPFWDGWFRRVRACVRACGTHKTRVRVVHASRVR
jgi:protein phosphatase methylesterase 1